MNHVGFKNEVPDSYKHLRLLKVKNKYAASEKDCGYPNAYLKECYQSYEDFCKKNTRLKWQIMDP